MIAISKSQKEQSNQLTLEPDRSPKWWALLGIGMGVFMFGLDVNIVNLALPTLVQSLHTSFSTIQWVVLSYLLMLSVMVLLAARLGDTWSKKWLFLGGLILFTISSLLCGLAPTISFLIGWRALQGLGAVFMSALSPAIITEVFPSSERGRGLGILGGIFTLGIALGPTVGGLLIGLWSWRLIFLINVPLGLMASLIVALVVPSSGSSLLSKKQGGREDQEQGNSQSSVNGGATLIAGKRTKEHPSSSASSVKQSFDAVGALLVTLTLTSFALGMTLLQREGFGSSTKLIMFAIAAISLACFLVVEARTQEPMLDLKMFRSLQLSLSLLLSLMVYLVLGGVIFALPFFLELVKLYPAQQAGLLMAVTPVLSGLMAPVAGILSDRFGSRIISLIGLVLMGAGCWTLGTINSSLTWSGYIVRVAPLGLGLGMFISPNNSAVMGAVPHERLGIASGLLSLSRTLGQTTGLPLMGTMLSTGTLASPVEMANKASVLSKDITHAPVDALVKGMQISLHFVAIIVMTAVILATILWWLEQKTEQSCSR